MKLVLSQQDAAQTISKMQLELGHATAMMTKMSDDHAHNMRLMREAIQTANTKNAELNDELNAARTHAALVESDLEGTKSALQLQLLSPRHDSPKDFGLTVQQEDAICREWEAVVEDLRVTHGANVAEITNELRHAMAIAANLNKQLATLHAEFFAEAQGPPTWQPPQPKEPTWSEAPSSNVRTRIAAVRATTPPVLESFPRAPPPGTCCFCPAGRFNGRRLRKNADEATEISRQGAPEIHFISC